MGSSGIGVCLRFRTSLQLKTSHKALQHAASSSEKALSSERLAFGPFWGVWGKVQELQVQVQFGFRVLGFSESFAAAAKHQTRTSAEVGVCMSSLQIARSVELRASQ